MKRVFWILGILLAVLILTEFLFVRHPHPLFPWHHWIGLQGAIGLGTCLLMVWSAKKLGEALLQRPENYDDES
jgi:hypothetical protein